MSWAIGFDTHWQRDIGYGVPAECDHPQCQKRIDRGLSYVCGGEPYGGEHGCGLYFCAAHQVADHQQCERCAHHDAPFAAKPDVAAWIRHKLTHASWQQWRDESSEEVATMRAQLPPSGPETETP